MSSPALGYLLFMIDIASWLKQYLPVVVRWLVLISATILVLFVAGLILTAIWSSPDENSVTVEPFTVVDSSGNLKNAENGFAQMLVARIDYLQGQINQSQTLLAQAGSAQGVGDQTSPSFGEIPPPRTEQSLLGVNPEIIRQDKQPFELKLQGVDVSGILTWIKARLAPKTESLRFTVHMGEDGMAIAGDIRALHVGANTIWIPASKQPPTKALDELALQLYQLKLSKNNPPLTSFGPGEFGDLIDHLFKIGDARINFRPEPERKKYFEDLQSYFAEMDSRFSDWSAMTILAAKTSHLAGNDDEAVRFLNLARQREEKQEYPDSEKIKQIQASIDKLLAAKSAASLAIIHTTSGAEASPKILRRSVDQLSEGDRASLKLGFQALYEAKGDKNYSAIAGLYGIPSWYSWHHRHRQGSSQNVDLFLPWNRAFLAHFEREARANQAGFSLPWWDWTQGRVPDLYMKPTDAKSNPLYAAFINVPIATPPIERYTRRFPNPGDNLPKSQDIEHLMQLTSWSDFASMLEDMSDSVHGLVGGNSGGQFGDMGSLGTAAFDPLFYAHACEVDRLWAEWQKRHPQASPDAKITDMVLEPFGIKVSDVLDTRMLGYSYDLPAR